MVFDSLRAETRFGFGLSPTQPAPHSVDAMLSGISGPDTWTVRYPISDYEGFVPWIARTHEATKALRAARGTAAETELREARRAIWRDMNAEALVHIKNSFLRRIKTSQGFRERLVSFWADHFTTKGKQQTFRAAQLSFVEDAIRPHLSGHFVDLLQAADTHPVMLRYLDQDRSMGDQSVASLRRKGIQGVNENLAREMLELHTLGVDGPYTQSDVRELAELLTGLSVEVDGRFVFRPNFTEPGSETVLGTEYVGRAMRPIRLVFEDLATHPATARHLARKLAVHFVSDDPDPGLVDHVARRWIETDGDLLAVYGALLDHRSAWSGPARNVKPPMDFIVSSLRALDVPDAMIAERGPRDMRWLFLGPLALMGQLLHEPTGPDGWPEEDAAWITPQGMSARLRWAMDVPKRLVQPLPDPRAFVETALGPVAPGAVRFAAGAAESRADAIGLILTSPSFQRR